MAPPEHAPGPTPTRAVYGFSMFLLFKTLFVLYVIWVFVPDTILRDQLYLTYLPDKYFAIFIPMLILVGVAFFAFFIYPGINLTITPDINDVSTVRDSLSLSPCQYVSPDGSRSCSKPAKLNHNTWMLSKFCDFHENDQENPEEITISNFCDCPPNAKCLLRDNPKYVDILRRKKQIPKVSDLPISLVCETLYAPSKSSRRKL
ncbi:uncharacterized protein DMENIID0001_020250 [Sergentomyia squamirostris]